MKFKRGDTFAFAGSVTNKVNGVDTSDFTGWTARSQVRTAKGRLIEELTVAWADASRGLITITAGDTTGWPIENVQIDVEFTSPTGETLSTETKVITVVQEITRAAA
jgi:hypothetical protein